MYTVTWNKQISSRELISDIADLLQHWSTSPGKPFPHGSGFCFITGKRQRPGIASHSHLFRVIHVPAPGG